MLPETVQRKLDALPNAPGVYLFRERSGGVLYVGKASNLRSRVRSYFAESNSDQRAFIAFLSRDLGDIETFVVGNEKEAALLENELIKQHQPRYNFKLRDDKDFLSIRIDRREAWPRLRVVRRPKKDNCQYFGPYDSATSARKTLRLVNRYFQLRTCKDTEFRSRVRPCLQFQIKRCPAPCVYDVDRNAYRDQLELVALFLDGRHDELVDDLKARMQESSKAMEYEQAATFRDQIRAIDRVRSSQRIATVKDIDQDVVGLYREGDRIQLAMLRIRKGRLNGVQTFELRRIRLPNDELVANFAREYYAAGALIPDELVLPIPIEADNGFEAWLSEERGRKVHIRVPQRGEKKHLLDMANENAAHAFREKARAAEDLESRLKRLQQRLRLPSLPRRIECVDISHIGGQDTVAAFTALQDGERDPKRYRTFRVKRVSGGDDYGAMHEVISRRLRRGRDGEDGWELPDLLIVDGGKGQLNVAIGAAHDLGIHDLPLAGLAKEKKAEGTVERVYLPGQKNAISLEKEGEIRFFLELVRDEAHRVSNAFREKLGKRRRLRSGLEDIAGVGPKTRNKLLKTLGSLKAIMEASEADLKAAGANTRQARAIATHFQGSELIATEAPQDAEEHALANAFDPVLSPIENDVNVDAS